VASKTEKISLLEGHQEALSLGCRDPKSYSVPSLKGQNNVVRVIKALKPSVHRVCLIGA